MTYDDLLIRNLALFHLGVEPIVALDEDTMQRQVTDALYPVCRDRLLATGYFDFAINRAVLSTPAADDPDEWRYLYRYDLPANTLRVLAAYRDPDDEPLVDWAETNHQLCTDYMPVYVVTATTADITDFTDLFVDALTALMASEMAIPLTKNADLRAAAFTLYNEKLTDARGYNTAYRQQQTNQASRAIKARYR